MKETASMFELIVFGRSLSTEGALKGNRMIREIDQIENEDHYLRNISRKMPIYH